MNRGRLGLVVVAVAVVGLLLVFGVSAATAPDRGVSGENTSRTLVGIQGGGVGLHEYGSVRLLDEQGQLVWGVGDADSYFDVTMTDNGTVMAGFMDSGYTDCDPYESPCTHTGFRILDPDGTDNPVYEYSFPVRSKVNSEVHDVERLPSGEYLLTDMDAERIFTIAPNGTTTWEWRASTLYDEPPDPTQRDWLHINDVDNLGDDRYLVSVRNANQLVIVHRGEGVVDIINEDRRDDNDDVCTAGRKLADYNDDSNGDVRCGDPDIMLRQHNPQWIAPDAVLVADSENDRIVELHREDEDSPWFIAWEIDSANGIDFRWPRDADRLENGNTLITDSANARIVEVTESGEVVWSASIENNYMPYEAERLPEGETVGAKIYNPEAGNVTRPSVSSSIPILTPALGIIQTSTNAPFWLGELHILAFLVGVAMIVGGTVTWWRERGVEDPADMDGL
jgi:hypothetical protein